MNAKRDLATQKSKEQFALLYEVSRAIVSSRYLDEILLLVVGLTAELTGSKTCSLMLLDPKKQELIIKATQSLSEQYRTKAPVRVGESASGRAVLTKQPITVLDVTKDEGYKYPQIAKQEGLKSLVCVPLMVKDQVIGVLNCYTAEEHQFTEDEIKILTGVANQAALAIENTRLFAEKLEAVEYVEVRKKVERAKGIIIKRQGLGEAQAYRLIQKKAMENRKSIKEIAEAIIVSDEVAA